MSTNIKFDISAKDNASAVLTRFNKVLGISQTHLASLRSSMNKHAAVAKMYVAAFVASSAALAANAVQTSTDFNRSLANVDTLLPSGTGRIEELKGQIQELSMETGDSAKNLADLAYQVVSAFGDSPDVIDKVRLAAKSAKAGVGEYGDSLALLSATTKAYGDTSLEAQKKVADLAQLTIKYGQTSMADLGTSIQDVTAMSERLSVSQEEIFASFSSTTGVLGNASAVATQMSAALKALMNPTTELSGVFDRLGISSGKALVQQRGLQGALKLIATSSEETGIPLQKLVGRAEAVKFILSTTGAQAQKFKSDLEAMKDSAGTLEEAYKKHTEGLSEVEIKMNRVRATFDNFRQLIGDRLSPIIIHFADQFLDATDSVEENRNAVKKLVNTTVTGFQYALNTVDLFNRGLTILQIPLAALRLHVSGLASLSGNVITFIYDQAIDKLGALKDKVIEFIRKLENIPAIGPIIGVGLDQVIKGIEGFDFSEKFTEAGEALRKRANLFTDYTVKAKNNLEKLQIAAEKYLNRPLLGTRLDAEAKQALDEFDKLVADKVNRPDRDPLVIPTALGMPSDDEVAEFQNKMKALLDKLKSGKELKDPPKELKNSFKEDFEDIKNSFSASLGAMVREGDASFKKIGKMFMDEVVNKISSKFISKGMDAFVGFLFPGFASGGTHSGGWRLVGENGPELEATGPSRIFNTNQTQQILAGAGGGSIIINQHYDFSGAGPEIDKKILQSIDIATKKTIRTITDMRARGKL
jgi:TP901 family phage tail tape measure protein